MKYAINLKLNEKIYLNKHLKNNLLNLFELNNRNDLIEDFIFFVKTSILSFNEDFTFV